MKLSAELDEGVRIAWDAIRGNILRSVLTTLGVVIGVVTVTLMAAAMEGLDRTFADAVSFLGTDVLYVDQREWFVDSQQKWETVRKRNKISMTQVRALERQLSGVKGMAPTVFHMVDAVRFQNRSSSRVTIIGTSEQFIITGGATLAAGRFMTRTEAYANRDVCIIGADVADKLFLAGSPLGHRIQVGSESLEVVGVLEKRGSVLGRITLDNQVILPIGKLASSFRRDPSCSIQVKAGDPAKLAELREDLRGLMRKIRRVPPGQPDDFAINQQDQLLERFGKVSTVIATSGFFITGLSLFVGGIGIMNIMFVSVAERTSEIGLRKALGARRRTILLQFLIEAACISLIGGFIALALAQVMVQFGRQFLAALSLSPGVVGVALAVALSTGVISGFLPAWRAARMRPVDALRQD